MNYPSIHEIETADRITISRWYRSLPSPGTNSISKDNFESICLEESKLMYRINERFFEMGGMTPEISKIVGPLHRN